MSEIIGDFLEFYHTDLYRSQLGIKQFYRLISSLFLREGSRLQTAYQAWDYYQSNHKEISAQTAEAKTNEALKAHPELAKYWN